MAVARIAAAFLAALLPVAGAQQSSQTHLTIQVIDPTGARIPGARIAIASPPSKSESALISDNNGQAMFNLPAGGYLLVVTAPAFEKLTRQIDVQDAANQAIQATLKIGSVSGPTMVAFAPPDVPLGSPQPVFVSLQPVSNLTPLPWHHPKRRW
jgi:hypothetical protein